jgi:hypothetical protein
VPLEPPEHTDTRDDSPAGAAEKPWTPETDLEWRELRQGRRLGERYVRIVRPHKGVLRRVEPGHLIATERADRPLAPVARVWTRFRRVIIGAPLTTAEAAHERLTKKKALAVLSADAISSSA